MSWKTDLGNFLRETGLGKFLILALVVAAVAISVSLYMLRVDRQPIQTEYVEVISKRLTDKGYAPRYGYRYHRYVTFRFPNGSEIEFSVGNFNLDDFQEGDTGMLSYKQIGDGIGVMTKRFVSFEKDK